MGSIYPRIHIAIYLYMLQTAGSSEMALNRERLCFLTILQILNICVYIHNAYIYIHI